MLFQINVLHEKLFDNLRDEFDSLDYQSDFHSASEVLQNLAQECRKRQTSSTQSGLRNNVL